MEMNKLNLAIAIIVLFYSTGANSQISGAIFYDFIANGDKDNTTNNKEFLLSSGTILDYTHRGAVQTSVSNSATDAFNSKGLNFPLLNEFTALFDDDYGDPFRTRGTYVNSTNFEEHHPADYRRYNLNLSFLGSTYNVSCNNREVLSPRYWNNGLLNNYRLQRGTEEESTIFSKSIMDSSDTPNKIIVDVGKTGSIGISCLMPDCKSESVVKI